MIRSQVQETRDYILKIYGWTFSSMVTSSYGLANTNINNCIKFSNFENTTMLNKTFYNIQQNHRAQTFLQKEHANLASNRH